VAGQDADDEGPGFSVVFDHQDASRQGVPSSKEFDGEHDNRTGRSPASEMSNVERSALHLTEPALGAEPMLWQMTRGFTGATDRPAPVEQAKPTARQRILVVDDDVEALEALSELLEVAGYDVERATQGAEVLPLAETSPPDAVFADLAMPHVDGYEVARRLAASERTKHIPVIAVTGRALSPATVLARGTFVDVFFKPIPSAPLLEFLKRLLETRAAGSP
jgi:CheY-like chemotaxis protein